jgi:hypothetical protein
MHHGWKREVDYSNKKNPPSTRRRGRKAELDFREK